MEIHVSLDGDEEERDGRRDLAGQIYRQLRSAILDGRLRPGDPLPPTRELAARLAVARNTVIVAYDKLAGEGFVGTRVGAGTYVSEELRPHTTAPPGKHDTLPAPRAVWSQMPEPPDLTTEPEFDFRLGLGDARLFPYQTWRRLVTTELRAANARNAGYADPAGHLDLRTAIARHVGVSRSVRVTPDDVVVTNGTQQAVDLIGRVLIEPGDIVAVEDPGYPPVRRLFESLGARVACVPVDAEGLVVKALPERTRLVFVTPSHQFPLGMPMSLPRRLALLAWAEHHNAVLVEDDYDSEFRFTGRPIEPLQNLDRAGRVIYVGTFSKVLLPILRLGFLVAPSSLHQALRTAKYVTDWHSPLTNQVALARFIEEGALGRHIRKKRNIYRERHERITTNLATDFRAWLTPVPSVAGLHVAAHLYNGSDETVVEQARRVGVHLPALSWFAADRTDVQSGLVLGYGAIQTERIDEGMRKLRQILSASGSRSDSMHE
ncbi:MAG TPA: PLP-dependent aminotransferase family protein [Actinopolymorphaceae bacterium]|nr:PLP-dependent aminotransferase family protein [Actinopolymorphaceae bacterium]